MIDITIRNWRSLSAIALIFLIFQLTACGAIHTSVKKKDLDVQTKMTDTIFLEPVAPAKRIIFVDIRNTSDKELNVEDMVIANMQSSGFVITDDPTEANYMLQANILQVGKSDSSSASDAFEAGFGGAVAGGVIGAAASGGDAGTAVAVGVAGALAALVGDALVEDTFYTVVTDLLVRERPRKGELINQSQRSEAQVGGSAKVKQTISGTSPSWKDYRTRIVSSANQANLEFAEAKSALEQGLVRSLSGIF